MNIVEATRNDNAIQIGVSPRGTLALFRASQAMAAVSGRDYVIPEDIKKMAPYVLNHRIIMKSSRDKSMYSAIDSILDSTEVPLENA